MIDVVDLFAGVGWTLACQELGLTSLGLDHDYDVVDARAANGMLSLRVDLFIFDPADLGIPFTGFIASPSCTQFSTAGSGQGRWVLEQIIQAAPAVASGVLVRDALPMMDPDASLVLAPLSWIAHHRPTWIALEQVRNVQPVWDVYAHHLKYMGYSVATGVLHTEQYGIPQTRDRSVLVANRTCQVTLPNITHSRFYPHDPARLDPDVEPWVTIADALAWAPDATACMRSNYGTSGVAANRGRRTAQQPAPTITTKIGRNKWVDGDIVARVNVAEAARLQTFPDDFQWGSVGMTAQYRIIGNSVPPMFAARTISAALGFEWDG